MKLPLLLARYLQDHKKLSLPGIGIFTYSSSKTDTGELTESVSPHIKFERTTIKFPEESLIEFIKKETGKIKPLAMADLDSYLSSGIQFLNIWKPFYIEGIGTIQKSGNGELEFKIGEVTTMKLEQLVKPGAQNHEKKTSLLDENKYEPKSNPFQRFIVAGLLIGGLAVVIFGGYYLYNKNSNSSNKSSQLQSAGDTSINLGEKKTDSIIGPSNNQTSLTPVSANDGYRFILETTTNKKRALRRYDQLRSYYIPIKMDTKDSTNFKLYFIINAKAADTTHIKDSLSRYYQKKVRMEY